MIEVLKDAKDLLALLALIISVGGAVYTWLTRRSDVNSSKLAKHESKLTEHDRRIQKLENDLEYLPSERAFHDLQIGITKLNGRLDTFAAQVEPLGHVVRRIEETLFSGGAK